MLLSEPIECTRLGLNPHVTCGLRVTMTCQCRFINGKELAAPVQDGDDGGGCAGEDSVLSVQLYCEPETTFKKIIKSV